MSFCLIINPGGLITAFKPYINSLQKSESTSKNQDDNSPKSKKSSASDSLEEETDEIKKISNFKYNVVGKIETEMLKKNNFELRADIALFYKKIPTPPPNKDIV